MSNILDKYTPLTWGDVHYPWEEDFGSSVIGWANRDSHNTAASALFPENILAVGEPWKDAANFSNVQNDPKPVLGNMVATPCLVTMDLTPVIAPALPHVVDDETVWDEVGPIDLWANAHRDLNYVNRVTSLDFSVSSLQFVNEAISYCIAGPLAFLFKCLDFSQLSNSINNRAIEDRNLLGAMGIDSLGAPTDPWTLYGSSMSDLISFINTKIIDKLNQYYWMYNFIPSIWRYPALLTRIWKESEDADNYSTLYTFKLPYIMQPGYCPDEESDKPHPQAVAGTFMMTPVDVPSTLWELAELIRDNVEFLIDDEDFRHITTTMQTILNKKDSGQLQDGITLSRAMFPYYPYFGRPVMITYEPAMLLAIHNATVVGVKRAPVFEVWNSNHQNEENKLVQIFELLHDESGATATQNLQYRGQHAMLKGRQPFDMPMAWTPDCWEELITASQFKVCSYPEQPSNEYYLSPKIMGRELITSVTIWRGNPNSQITGRGMTINSFTALNSYAIVGEAESINDSILRHALTMAQCAFLPLMPFVLRYGVDSHFELVGYSTDIQHLSWIPFRALQAVKQQFIKNALGYPLVLPGNSAEGSFSGLQKSGEAVGNDRGSQEKVDNAYGGSSGSNGFVSRSQPSRRNKKRKSQSSNGGAADETES